VIALPLFVAAWLFASAKWDRFLKIDSCLDRGFSWDYMAESCDETFNPGDLSSHAQCSHYGGEWDEDADVCIGAEGDPWPPAGGFHPQGN